MVDTCVSVYNYPDIRRLVCIVDTCVSVCNYREYGHVCSRTFICVRRVRTHTFRPSAPQCSVSNVRWRRRGVRDVGTSRSRSGWGPGPVGPRVGLRRKDCARPPRRRLDFVNLLRRQGGSGDRGGSASGPSGEQVPRHDSGVWDDNRSGVNGRKLDRPETSGTRGWVCVGVCLGLDTILPHPSLVGGPS